jgi:hypothetical protein
MTTKWEAADLTLLGHSRLPLRPKSVGRREKRPGVDLASKHERESYSIRRAV